MAPVAVVVLLGAGFAAVEDDWAAGASSGLGVDFSAIPQLAREMLPALRRDLETGCPALPALWVVAEIQAESSWNPRAYSTAGAAGLLQMTSAAWLEASGAAGGWATGPGPASSHPVWDPTTHLAVAIRWMCRNLRAVTAHLQATGKPTGPLDALAVCHLAGCSRVTGSATGIPTAGETGCDADCARQVTDYLAAIHRNVEKYAAAVPTPVAGAIGAVAADPHGRGAAGCRIPDASGTGGCVTPAMAWLMGQVVRQFGHLPVACWSARGGDPYSDHPTGRACDYTFGRIGVYPGPADVRHGWALAFWLHANAAGLHVNYVIWQGRIWSRAHDTAGWRPYTGGGHYDATGPTNGHYDHVHVSTTD